MKGHKQKSAALLRALGEFKVYGDIVNVRSGPVVTLYEFVPAAGIKESKVAGLAPDLARVMKAVSCRIAVVPGQNVIGIELPNAKRSVVPMKGLLNKPEFKKSDDKLPVALGVDIKGDPVVVDISKMPHLLVAGTTGSGKSVAMNTFIVSLLKRLTPEEVRFIMIDPKMLELSVYNDIPHLLTPVITDPSKAVHALKWAVSEMELRYSKMTGVGVRNITGYNETASEKMPYIVVVIDEVADLMMVAGKEIEGMVQRLAQMARAAGIHVIMATQRPSVDVITGTIKANFPTRISFQVTSRFDSRTILGEQGAEQLLGKGDMLFMQGGGQIKRVHGAFIPDDEVATFVDSLKRSTPQFVNIFGVNEAEAIDDDPVTDYDRAVVIVTVERRSDPLYLQRRLELPFVEVLALVERLERNGVIAAPNPSGGGKRRILRALHELV